MTTWTNESKNEASFTNQEKSPIATDAFSLKIDDTYSLLIEGAYTLLTQEATAGWENQTKN